MSHFYLSQILIGIAICFDLMSFQFKDRRKIVGTLFFSGLLISTHFILLEQWTAACLSGLAALRFLVCVWSTSRIVMYVFCGFTLLATCLTYSGLVSLVSCSASLMQNIASFHKDDKRLREIMIIGVSLWMLNNYLVGSPTAVLMEFLFICSNIVGYYRYYIRPRSTAL